MKQGWQVGSLFNIPLFIDPSWFFIVALVAFLDGLAWQEQYPGWRPIMAWGAGVAMALLLFTSVLLHELGHSLVARSQGINVRSITLFLFGGIASIEHESKTPGQAFQVAIAGPLVSISLWLLLSLGASFMLPESPIRVLSGSLAGINLILALFNLIPGLPLDGGQILKAAVWKATGDRFKGVHWAAKVGQLLGWLAVILGIGTVLLAGNYTGLWISLLGWFGLQNASHYDRLTDMEQALVQLKAEDAMTREFRVVDADQTLRQFADEYLLTAPRAPAYFAAADGRYRGLVRVEDLNLIERSQWETQNVQALVRPLNEIASSVQTTTLAQVIKLLEEQHLPRITVLSPAGAIAGIIDRGDIVRTLAQKLNLRISETDIKQIKELGSYPPSLQLPAIVQAIVAEPAAQPEAQGPASNKLSAD